MTANVKSMATEKNIKITPDTTYQMGKRKINGLKSVKGTMCPELSQIFY